jgi:excisionase family DNA binding protein
VPHLSQVADARPEQEHVAYTVASLAAELGVSQRTIRCAVARRELPAVKRGSRWIISAEAVRTWSAAAEDRRRTSRACRPSAPKAAGPSLRSVFCGDAGRGRTR